MQQEIPEYEYLERYIGWEDHPALCCEITERFVQFMVDFTDSDERVITPGCLDHRELEQRVHGERVLTILNKEVELQVMGLNGELGQEIDINDKLRPGFADKLRRQDLKLDELTAAQRPRHATFYPLTASRVPQYLYHLACFFNWDQRDPPALDHHMQENLVLGNPDTLMPTYLKTWEARRLKQLGIVDERITAACPVLLEIDTNVLVEQRNVFYDPEAVTLPEEYGHTYLVFGGVPRRAVRGLMIADVFNVEL